jgi:hypothetical protein
VAFQKRQRLGGATAHRLMVADGKAAQKMFDQWRDIVAALT